MVLGGTGSVYDDTGWYLVSISWYCLVRWYMVSKGLVCLNILEKVEIWSGVTDASQTTEYRATQLVSSIKHKLSHAISTFLIRVFR